MLLLVVFFTFLSCKLFVVFEELILFVSPPPPVASTYLLRNTLVTEDVCELRMV